MTRGAKRAGEAPALVNSLGDNSAACRTRCGHTSCAIAPRNCIDVLEENSRSMKNAGRIEIGPIEKAPAPQTDRDTCHVTIFVRRQRGYRPGEAVDSQPDARARL